MYEVREVRAQHIVSCSKCFCFTVPGSCGKTFDWKKPFGHVLIISSSEISAQGNIFHTCNVGTTKIITHLGMVGLSQLSLGSMVMTGGWFMVVILTLYSHYILYILLHIDIPPISADPGLSQGRGGAWDHRRCGTHPSLWLSSNRKTFPGTFQEPLGPWPLSAKLWHPLRPQLLKRSKVPFSRPQIFGTCFGGFRSYSGYGRRLRGVLCQALAPAQATAFFFKAFKGATWQALNA